MTDRKRDDANAADLLPALYDELRRLAAAQMSRGAPGSTLQPTALVHEAWLRLGGDQRRFESKAHFFSAAAEAMRHILIDRARQRRALKHGGDQQRVDIQEIEIPVNQEDDDQVIAVSDAVDKLAREHPEIAELVKLRCFVGLEVSEAAQALGIPRTTAYRRWMFARTWLYKELHPDKAGGNRAEKRWDDEG
jgi:RNA polymerase sigma factor (TIGR02999 family)